MSALSHKEGLRNAWFGRSVASKRSTQASGSSRAGGSWDPGPLGMEGKMEYSGIQSTEDPKQWRRRPSKRKYRVEIRRC